MDDKGSLHERWRDRQWGEERFIVQPLSLSRDELSDFVECLRQNTTSTELLFRFSERYGYRNEEVIDFMPLWNSIHSSSSAVLKKVDFDGRKDRNGASGTSRQGAGAKRWPMVRPKGRRSQLEVALARLAGGCYVRVSCESTTTTRS